MHKLGQFRLRWAQVLTGHRLSKAKQTICWMFLFEPIGFDDLVLDPLVRQTVFTPASRCLVGWTRAHGLNESAGQNPKIF